MKTYTTRAGIEIPDNVELFTLDHICLDDIAYSLSRRGTFGGHTVMPWPLSARAINFYTYAVNNFDLDRDELLTLMLRDAHHTYGFLVGIADIVSPISDIRDRLAEKFQFDFLISNVKVSQIVTDVIKDEMAQLLTPTTKPNTLTQYANPDGYAEQFKKIITNLLKPLDNEPGPG